MIINQITITAEASKAYQKYCVALTAQDLQEVDIEFLKQMAISEAVKGIDELAGNIEVKPEVKVSQQPVRQAYQPQQGYQKQPQGYTKPYQAPKQVKPVSEAQINYLTGLGYTGPMPTTWEQADQLLKQLKAQRGLN